MIEMLMFKKDYRTFKENDLIPFVEGVNLLVGDQGCGKSTILQLLCALGGVKSSFWKRDHSIKPKDVAVLFMLGTKKVFAHDYENDSARTSPSFETMGQIPLGAAMAQMRMSHGQATNSMVNIIATMKDAYLILDEPDSGMSCRSALTLADAMKKAAENGCQIIASVHHPWLIEAFPRVHSIEHRKTMTSEKFLQSMREPPTEPTK